MFSEKGNNGFVRTMLVILIATVVLGAITYVFISKNSRKPSPQSNNPQLQNNVGIPNPQQISVDLPSGMSTTEAVAKSSIPGVVGISVLKVESGAIFDRNTAEKWGVGSGIVANSNGYIITNNHVAGGKSKRIIVSLSDGRNIDGTTLWSDPIMDLAVVKVNLTGLPTIPLGDANSVRVGQPAIAIGNPFGLELQRTVTSGIISAVNRTIKIDTDQGPNYMEDLLQTDASINPGNSGGPLLNSKGEVIGINTIKVTSAEAIGFAIPINAVVPVLNKIIEKGDFKEPYMGVFAYDKEVIPYLNNKIKLDNGIYIATVDQTGPAYKSGIKQGCIIKQVDGIKINTMMQLRQYIYTKNPGDVVNVTHLSNGKTMTIPIKLSVKGKPESLTR
ncbi:MAG: S1C family serine protease [Bacillota bacterium]|nr:S1C family serine protease [Bacillota bacterium]